MKYKRPSFNPTYEAARLALIDCVKGNIYQIGTTRPKNTMSIDLRICCSQSGSTNGKQMIRVADGTISATTGGDKGKEKLYTPRPDIYLTGTES